MEEEEAYSSVVDETSKIMASPGPVSEIDDSAKPTQVGPANVTQDEKPLLVDAERVESGDGAQVAMVNEEVIEDEMVKSEEENEPVQANE